MSDLQDITLVVNGREYSRRVSPRESLGDFLRHNLGFTGTHIGCEHGVCGACVVRFDGVITRSCLTLAVQASGCEVETIEGVSNSGELADLEQAFLERNALQCGFCTPGMLLTAAEFLNSDEAPTREAIRDYMSGNICRCTGYQAIVDAVESVAAVKPQGEI